MARHRFISNSTCAPVPIVSVPASATMRATLPRTAAISARLTEMLESCVRMSQPRAVTSGIQIESRTAGDVIGQAGHLRLCKMPPGSPG